MFTPAIVGSIYSTCNISIRSHLPRGSTLTNLKGWQSFVESRILNVRSYGKPNAPLPIRPRWNRLNPHKVSFLRPNNVPRHSQVRHTKPMKPYEVNTNVLRNVILYRNNKSTFFKVLNIFGFTQLFGWGYLAYITYSSHLTDLFSLKENFLEYAEKHIYSLAVCTCSIVLAIIVISMVWLLTVKSIKTIMLQKGGRMITFMMYHPIGLERPFTVPLDAVSCSVPRESLRPYLPLKIEDRLLYFLLENEKENFINPELFDYTAGLHRY